MQQPPGVDPGHGQGQGQHGLGRRDRDHRVAGGQQDGRAGQDGGDRESGGPAAEVQPGGEVAAGAQGRGEQGPVWPERRGRGVQGDQP